MDAAQILDHIRNARYQLREARALAPNKSNLSDDIDGVAETLDEIGSALHAGEFDDTGMGV